MTNALLCFLSLLNIFEFYCTPKLSQIETITNLFFCFQCNRLPKSSDHLAHMNLARRMNQIIAAIPLGNGAIKDCSLFFTRNFANSQLFLSAVCHSATESKANVFNSTLISPKIFCTLKRFFFNLFFWTEGSGVLFYYFMIL